MLCANEYVDRTRMAITMVERAELDLEKAEETKEKGDMAAAKKLFQAVLDNEYATKAQRNAAQDSIKKLGKETPAVVKEKSNQESPAKPATANESQKQENSTQAQTVDSERARTLTAQGHEALQSGRYSEATRLFEEALQAVPGYPEAVNGLNQARGHSEVEVGSRTLIDRIKRRNEIKWDRAKQKCRDLQTEIQDAVLSQRFELAKQLLLSARQVVEGARQYADPLVKYESLSNELAALAAHVEDEARQANIDQVREQRENVQRQEAERKRKVAETRQLQVETLMTQAVQLRKDRDFKEAVSVLSQLLTLDPKNERARWLRDDLEDIYEMTRQKESRDEMYREQQRLLVDAEEGEDTVA